MGGAGARCWGWGRCLGELSPLGDWLSSSDYFFLDSSLSFLFSKFLSRNIFLLFAISSSSFGPGVLLLTFFLPLAFRIASSNFEGIYFTVNFYSSKVRPDWFMV